MHSEHSSMRSLPLVLCALLAVVLHAGALFAWRYQAGDPSILDVAGDAVEVSLVEAAEGNGAAAELLPPGEPASVPPTMRVVEEVAIRQPSPPEPVEPRKAAPRDAAKAMEGQKLPQVKKSESGGGGRDGGPAPQKGGVQSLLAPAYVSRPTVKYPSESRAAREEGVVVLRITVNDSGRPVSVEVARSSGFVRLDRAAVEGGWRCRIANALEGARFEAPLRFSLKD